MKRLGTNDTTTLSDDENEEQQAGAGIQLHKKEPSGYVGIGSDIDTGFISGPLSRLRNWLSQLNARIETEGTALRAVLTSDDVQMIKLARFLFHSCSILPPLLYYMGAGDDNPPKFPATISFTIRKGVPKQAQLLLWVAGWACMSNAVRRSQVVQKFCAKMFLTGVWTTVLFRLGRDAASDAAHFVGAGVYMLDHIVMMKVLKTKPTFRKAFYASLLVLLTSIGGTHAAERVAGLPMESCNRTNTADRARRIAALPTKLRRRLFFCELLVMLSENLLFASFIQGMPSGLEDVDAEKQAKIIATDSNQEDAEIASSKK